MTDTGDNHVTSNNNNGIYHYKKLLIQVRLSLIFPLILVRFDSGFDADTLEK